MNIAVRQTAFPDPALTKPVFGMGQNRPQSPDQKAVQAAAVVWPSSKSSAGTRQGTHPLRARDPIGAADGKA
jgi:hypothetical protein